MHTFFYTKVTYKNSWSVLFKLETLLQIITIFRLIRFDWNIGANKKKQKGVYPRLSNVEQIDSSLVRSKQSQVMSNQMQMIIDTV